MRLAPLEADTMELTPEGIPLRLTLRAGDAAMSILLTAERALQIRDAFDGHAARLNRAAGHVDAAAAELGGTRAERRRAEREGRRRG